MNNVLLFLQTGNAGNDDPSLLATDCDNHIRGIASKSLIEAISLSKKFVKHSKKSGGPLLATAYRSLARNSHMSGKYPQAETAYLHARELNKKDVRIRSLIDRALIDVYMYLGDLPQANRRVRSALKGFKKIGAEDDVAKTNVNYANLLHRQDRHREAEEIYRQAAEYFEKTKELPAVARCYYNRANPLVQLFEFDKAEKLYNKSKEIYLGLGQELDACDVDYSLAWLKMLRGDYHPALLELEACEKIYTNAGQSKGAALCQLDRAELLLSLRLYSDAYDVSHNVAKKFKKLDISYEYAKSLYFKAMSALYLGKKRPASIIISKIITIFKKEKNYGFEGACYLLQARLQDDLKEKRKLLKKANQQFQKSQLPLWETVTQLELSEFSGNSLEQLKSLSKNKVIKTVPFLFSNWQTMLGEEYFSAGKTKKALHYWKKAAERIDTIRNQLPPVEFRTGYNKSELSPHVRLIQHELPTNPAMASVWAERFQTVGTWAPVEPSATMHAKIENSLSQLGKQLIALYRQKLNDSHERSLKTDQYSKNVNNLQKQIKNQLTHIENQNNCEIISIENLQKDFKKVAHKIPIMQLLTIENDVLVFFHDKNKLRYHRYPNGANILSDYLRQWRFVLEKVQLTPSKKINTILNLEEKLLKSIGAWLWEPLGIENCYKNILVISSGELANIPWQGLIVDNKTLSDSTNFIICPSLRHYMSAKSTKVHSQKQILFSGNPQNVPMVQDEINFIKNLSKKETLVFSPSKKVDWPKSGKFALWHYAGHSFLRSDNPFYSYLELGDGPLFATDFRLRDVQVNLVVLAACRTAEQTTSSGEEPTGLVRSLLEMGAKNILAGQWPVSDKITTEWMKIFYSEYFSSNDILSAINFAKNEIRKKYKSVYYWGPFVIYGASA